MVSLSTPSLRITILALILFALTLTITVPGTAQPTARTPVNQEKSSQSRSPSPVLIKSPSPRPNPNSFNAGTLFGRVIAPAGWGTTQTTVTSPGPTIIVNAGQTSSIQLGSADGAGHNWAIDYNNACTTAGCTTMAGDPISPMFSTTTLLNFTFTPTTKAGNYTYWCFIHFGAMHGTIQIKQQGTLYGRVLSPQGWGTTSATVASPGPTITVSAGQNVTMLLASADSVGHNWGIDYNHDTTNTTGDPISKTFSTITLISFTFIATSIPGNYTYYCFIHFGPMMGTFQVKTAPHDVAIQGVNVAGAGELTRNFAYSGVSVAANPLQVNITVVNLGTLSENFAVFAKANTTLIGNMTMITLLAGRTTIITFNWDTTPLAKGIYQLTANTTRITGNVNPGKLFAGPFTVKLKGDVNGDHKVDISDLSIVGAQFGKTTTTPGFNNSSDINNDGQINIVDLVGVASNFGTMG